MGLAGCGPSTGAALFNPPEPASIVQSPPLTFFSDPPPPALSPAGRALIYEFEVGGRSGYNSRPEAPDARASGVTWGIGYDGHQNAPKVITADWQALGDPTARRLADTHPFYGRSAQAHLHEVRDILVAFGAASDVFDRIDVAREFSAARRAYGVAFEALRPNAQAALISNGFNRGYSTVGANRTELRAIVSLVPSRDYDGMAAQLQASARVWRGTSIENGMRRRRFAEAALMRTP